MRYNNTKKKMSLPINGDIFEIEPALSWDAATGTSDNDSKVPTKIDGDPELCQKLKALFSDFEDVFSQTLSSEPALLPRIDIEVNIDKWEVPSNRGAPRLTSVEKQEEIKRQIEKMLALNLIRVSSEPYYSQILLTTKPGGKWRLVVDFRPLNLCTKDRGWPLPSIQQMVARIGHKKPKYFANSI